MLIEYIQMMIVGYCYFFAHVVRYYIIVFNNLSIPILDICVLFSEAVGMKILTVIFLP